MEGKQAGDSLSVRIAPEDGYGQRHEEMVQVVPREQLPPQPEPEVGMRFQARNESNQNFLLTVIEVEGGSVKLDGNHLLAGVALNFEVEVVSVREATAEELEHGHVHGPGGHAH